MYKKERSASPTSPMSGVSVIYYTDDEEKTLTRKNVKDKCPKRINLKMENVRKDGN